MSTQACGNVGENLATQYLQKKGYAIIARNVIWHQQGEVDIFAMKDEYLVCVEVKARFSLVVPFAALIPLSKQRRLIKTAQYYAQKNKIADKVIRFDVVFVDLTKKPPHLQHIENAFVVHSKP